MKAKNSVFTFCTLVLVFLIMLMLIAFVTERKFADKKVDNSAEESSSVLDDGEIIIGEIDYFFEAKGVYGDFGFNDTVSVGLTKTEVSI